MSYEPGALGRWPGLIPGSYECGNCHGTVIVDQDAVVRSGTPAGTVASVVHMGPYGGLGAAHEAIRRWSAETNQRLAGPKWEIYGHWQQAWDADPSQIRTDVCYLIG